MYFVIVYTKTDTKNNKFVLFLIVFKADCIYYICPGAIPRHIIRQDHFCLANKLKHNLENKSIDIFLTFLKNSKNQSKIEEIKGVLTYYIDNKNLPKLNYEVFNQEEKILFFSILIFKSITKISSFSLNDGVTYLDSDKVLNNFLLYYRNFVIFYNLNDRDNNISLKKKIFKIISVLTEKKIIHQKLIRNKEKTIKAWWVGLDVDNYLFDIDFNMSSSPFEMISFNGDFYLRGESFIYIFKIFRENLRSGEEFKLQDISYMNKLNSVKTYICKKDLLRIIKIMEKSEKFDESSIKNQIRFAHANLILYLKQVNDGEKRVVDENKIQLIGNIDEQLKIKNPKNILLELILTLLEIDLEKNFFDTESLYNNILGIFCKNNKISINKEAIKKKIDQILNTSKLLPIRRGVSGSSEIELFDIMMFYSRECVLSILQEEKDTILSQLREKPENRNSVKEPADWGAALHYLSFKFKSNQDFKILYKMKADITCSDMANYKKAASLFSKLLTYNHLYLIKNLLNEDNQLVHFPFYFDFRGRMYYDSQISPTFFKYSRYFINYGFYSTEEIYNSKTLFIDEFIKKYENFILEAAHLLNIQKIHIKKIRECVFWCLISMGKIRLEKKNTAIPLNSILETAIDLIKNSATLVKFLDKIEFDHYKEILISLNSDQILRRCILKDATASFIQNLIRLLGYKDKNSLKYANLLDSDHWYDTYSFILQKWLEKDGHLINEEVKKIFNRKTIKKTVMTNPYAATYLTSFNYFVEAVYESTEKRVTHKSEEGEAFKKFFQFVKEEVETGYFLKNNSKSILTHVKNNWSSGVKIESHDSTSNLIYYKLVSKSYDIEISIPGQDAKKRITKKFDLLDKLKVDREKILTSIRANWVHYIDALLVRDINRNTPGMYISIHDCFMVDALYVSDFIQVANNQSNIKIFESYKWNNENTEKFFSIFIFI